MGTVALWGAALLSLMDMSGPGVALAWAFFVASWYPLTYGDD